MRNTRRIAAAALLLALTSPLRGHGVAPLQITMSPGSSDFIYVIDGGSCPADITAVSTNPAIQVHALNMFTGGIIPGGGTSATALNRVDQVFLVLAPLTITPTSGTIDICWVGSTSPNAPCPENNCSPPSPTKVGVTVKGPPYGAGNRLSSGIAGDPIATSSGEFFCRERPDLNLRGPLPLGFQRYFGGHLEMDGVGPGPLGPNWRHGFEWSWTSAGNALHFTTPMGREIRFETDFFNPGTWTQVGSEDVEYSLRETGNPGPPYVLADTLGGLMYTFNFAGQLTQIEDQNGNTLTLTYNFADLTQVTDGLGRTLSFTYNTGKMASVSDGTRTVAFTYAGNGSLQTVTDTSSNVMTYAYDPTWPTWLISKTYPEGNVRYVQTYTPAGKVATQTAAGAHTTTLAYDTVAGTTTITDPLMNTQVHSHTATGEMTGHQGESGTPAPLGYDTEGRRNSVVDRDGNTTQWSWHPSGKIAQMVEADGRTSNFGYTARVNNGFTFYDLTSIARADGRSETFTYDANGNLTGHRDTRGNDWSWTYDGMGQVLTATNPSGGVTTLTWNPDGTLATSLDDAGNLTTHAFDALRRVSAVTQADATTLAYTYDAADRVLTITDELTNVTTFAYDKNGNLTSITDPATQAWTFAYDSMDRLETATDPLTRTMTATFDELGRPKTVTGANGKTTTYGYDSSGDLTSITNHKNKTWSRGYDADSLLVSTTDPLNRTANYAVDAMGRYSSVTSPLGGQTNFTYDAMGRVTQVRSPLLATTTFAYDPLGLVSSIALPDGATSNFARNALGLVTQITDPLGNPWMYAYDAQGRRTSQTDPLGNQSTYQYDPLSRVDRLDFPGGMGSVDVTYDSAGRILQRSYSDGTLVDLTYDTVGRATSGTDLTLGYDAAGRMASSNGVTITRNPGGLISNITFAAGKTVSYSYDDSNRLSLVLDFLGGATFFTYDDAGQLTNILRGNQVNTQYAYDADGRVTRIIDQDPFADHTQADHFLVRDAEGRITSAQRVLPVEGTPAINALAYTYDAAGQTVGFTHDALGRVTNDGIRAYAWNLASHLTSFTEGGSTVSFTYDAFDNVRSRTEQGVTERFIWNYALALPSISVVRQAGTDQCYYVHTPGGDLLYSIDAATNARTHYHYDEAGNTVLLTNDAGLAIDAFHMTPSGVELAQLGANRTPFTFGGQMGVMKESNSGLYRMRARLYDATTGRFLSRDPVEAGDPRGVNPYQYAYGDPLRYVDPRGTTPEPAEGGLLVTVESRFVTVEDNFLEELGVDHRGLFTDEGDGALKSRTEDIFNSTLGSAVSSIPFLSSTLNDVGLGTMLRALQKDERSIVVSAPRLLIVNDEQPSFRQLGELANQLSVIAGSSNPIIAVTDGIVLDVRPAVSADRRFITIELTPKVATITQGTSAPIPGNYRRVIRKLRDHYLPRVRYTPLFTVPGISTRSTTTMLNMPDMGTVMIGGLLRKVESAFQNSVPVLNKIPGLGALFRNTGGNHPSPLLILIRARITSMREET
jgi:RHS repeat-associated protein